MHHLNIDIETFSSVSIKDAGLYKYAQSPDFEILLFAYSLDGAPVQVVDFTNGERISENIWSLLFSNDCVKHAYNAAFEWYCLSRAFDLPWHLQWLNQWQDTMLHAVYCGYPAGLEAAGSAMGLPEDKKKLSTGKALIRTFCTPKKPTDKDTRTRVLPEHEPEKWQLFKEYNRQDVVTEQEIECRLSLFPVPTDIQAQWVRDLIINERGVAVDLDLINGALTMDAEITSQLTEEAIQLTKLENPNSVSQLIDWMNDQGVKTATLRKNDVTDLLDREDLPANARRVLELRQEMSRTSTKKYAAMMKAVCGDGRVRGLLQFYGANRTGRWAGRLVQIQNLPRTYIKGKTLDLARDFVRKNKTQAVNMVIGVVPDVLSQLVRTAFIPAEGNSFVDADFSAIEARVIAWLAKEEWVLDVFKTHGKIYEAQAAQMFGVPMESIKKGEPNYALRQRGKVATLALGYQGGTGSLVSMGALRMGIPEDDLQDIVRRWRDSNQRIVSLWYAIERAAINTVQTGFTNTVNGLIFAREADTCNDFLTIQLPSGRKLYYCRPFIERDERGRQRLRHWGISQTSKKWMVLDTYGGKLTENIVQAIARDCLAINITRLEAAGYPVVFHIHDEVVIDAPPDKANLAEVIKIMSQPIEWAPGLPLSADGWVGEYFTKD